MAGGGREGGEGRRELFTAGEEEKREREIA
jgi:hypothetical protein